MSDQSGPTKIRHVRIADSLWSAATAKAQSEGRKISEVIRALLVAYVKGD